MNRREFQRLTLAALSGMLAGSAIGAPRAAGQDKGPTKKDSKKNPLLVEPHVCRGLNTCKGLGPGKSNACAGQGTCATVQHQCGGDNECRGQGGCGAQPGENDCKASGQCAVPMHDSAWKKARKRFEELMVKQGKQVGPAPAKKNPS
jgi:hypothetical protein